LTKEDISIYDFYSSVPPIYHIILLLILTSCFPIVPKLASAHLGLSLTAPSKPITLLGGLTSFGGAGNNYSMHALIEMTRELRKAFGEPRHGLVLANGGYVSHEYVVCLSSRPRKDGAGYPERNPLEGKEAGWFVPTVDEKAEGEANIEVCPRHIISPILRFPFPISIFFSISTIFEW
jgi:hypothetical protein